MADPATQTHRGSCLCGAVAYEVEGPLRPVIVCHCRLCRAWSGHVFAATSAPLLHFRLTRQKGLAWYRSSPAARRGFCGACGASLFWKPEGEERMSFAAGSLDGVTGLAVIQHLLPEEAGDYYSPEGPPPPAAEVRGRAEASCICGACRFSLPLPLGPATACHCSQCRKLSGHYAASFDVAEAAVDWLARETLRTCRTRGGAERGFCGACGSSLWFRAPDGSFSVEGGCVEGATGGRLAGHIFTAGKGDYYAIDDGLPQTPGA